MQHETASQAELLALLPDSERAAILAELTDDEARGLEYDWKFWGRPNQWAPQGDWTTWVILAGRGYGKTRCGVEWLRSRVEGPSPMIALRGGARHIALIAETSADARDVMVEGESGILASSPPWQRPMYEPSKRRLTWPNGARATLFNGTEPDQLRGPQHDTAWVDELCKYAYPQDTWEMLQFGLRLGNPRQVVTTTPRPLPVLKEIMADPDTVVMRGSSYENRGNLSPKFFRTVIRKYEGTRLGRQELNAEILDDVPGALWTLAQLDATRVKQALEMVRIVVGIDPAMTSGEDADETGIVAAGKGRDGEYYILADRSGHWTPDQWGRRAVALYDELKADRIVGEVNNGGEMVEHVVRTAAKAMRLGSERGTAEVSYRAVHATRGKRVRAEPVSMLWEQGRAHMVGSLAAMEDQMRSFVPDRSEEGRSPDRLDAMVWAMTELMGGTDGVGFVPVVETRESRWNFGG